MNNQSLSILFLACCTLIFQHSSAQETVYPEYPPEVCFVTDVLLENQGFDLDVLGTCLWKTPGSDPVWDRLEKTRLTGIDPTPGLPLGERFEPQNQANCDACETTAIWFRGPGTRCLVGPNPAKEECVPCFPETCIWQIGFRGLVKS